jgi:fructuronate reductase
VCHLRGSGATVTDARDAEFVQLASGPLPEAVCLVLKALDPDLAADEAVMVAVLAQARELGQA